MKRNSMDHGAFVETHFQHFIVWPIRRPFWIRYVNDSLKVLAEFHFALSSGCFVHRVVAITVNRCFCRRSVFVKWYSFVGRTPAWSFSSCIVRTYPRVQQNHGPCLIFSCETYSFNVFLHSFNKKAGKDREPEKVLGNFSRIMPPRNFGWCRCNFEGLNANSNTACTPCQVPA